MRNYANFLMRQRFDKNKPLRDALVSKVLSDIRQRENRMAQLTKDTDWLKSQGVPVGIMHKELRPQRKELARRRKILGKIFKAKKKKELLKYGDMLGIKVKVPKQKKPKKIKPYKYKPLYKIDWSPQKKKPYYRGRRWKKRYWRK